VLVVKSPTDPAFVKERNFCSKEFLKRENLADFAVCNCENQFTFDLQNGRTQNLKIKYQKR